MEGGLGGEGEQEYEFVLQPATLIVPNYVKYYSSGSFSLKVLRVRLYFIIYF
jgi:hypothetical protein